MARHKFTLLWCLAGLALAGAAGYLSAREDPRTHNRSIETESQVSSKRPVEIQSDEMSFAREGGLTVFKGNVHVNHQPTTMTADEVAATSGNRKATAEGSVKVVDSGMAATLTCGQLEYKDQMRYITAHDSPKLGTVDSDGFPVTMESRQMEFFSEQHMAVANQNVKITHLEGTAKAGRATYLKDEGRLVMEDEPRMDSSYGTLTGRRITAFLDENRIVAEGNVQAMIYPTPQADKKSSAPAGPTAPNRGGRPPDPALLPASPTPTPTPTPKP